MSNCPLDHSTLEKFIGCDCNYGESHEIWNFQQSKIDKLEAENEKLKEAVKLWHESTQSAVARHILKELEQGKKD